MTAPSESKSQLYLRREATDAFRFAAVLAAHAPESACRAAKPVPGTDKLDYTVLWDTARDIKLDLDQVEDVLSSSRFLDLRTTSAGLDVDERMRRHQQALVSSIELLQIRKLPSSCMRTVGDLLATQMGVVAQPYAQCYPALVKTPRATQGTLDAKFGVGIDLLALWLLMQDYDLHIVLSTVKYNSATDVLHVYEPGALRLEDNAPGDAPYRAWYLSWIALSGHLSAIEASKRLGRDKSEYIKQNADKFSEMFNLVEAMSARGVPFGDALAKIFNSPGLWTRKSSSG